MSTEWRRNPFTGEYVPALITDEPHTVAFIVAKGLYGIQLDYVPIQTTPHVLVIKDANTLVPLVEKPHTLDPNANEFRVDYEAENQSGTGTVEMNSADNNRQVLVTYKHCGLVVQAKGLAVLLDGQTVANLAIGSLNINTLLNVLGTLTSRNPRLRNAAGSFYVSLTGEPTANRVQTLADKTAAFVYDDEFEGLSSGKRQVHKDRILGLTTGYAVNLTEGGGFTPPSSGTYVLLTDGSNGKVYDGVVEAPLHLSTSGNSARVYSLTGGQTYSYNNIPNTGSKGTVFAAG